MEFFDPNAELTPDSPCPAWCVMHFDGSHVAELGDPTVENDRYSVYVRETDEGAGEVGIEVIVADKSSFKTTRVSIDAAAVQASAAQSEAERAASIQAALQRAVDKQGDQEEPGQ